ncbi:MAG: hypothetical protein HY834_03440 [Devosia nanyangense]|uniref:Uncharacterized protein n=1 Tax=Devosia nanyangense TaxID=1228055 RepID=A0A933L064_9HYPH|nr:hypothetical protein [Devosia nanyangense]
MSTLAVFAPRRFLRLLAGDALNVSRDPMLLFAIAMSLAPAAALYFGKPAIDAAALSAFGVASLSAYLVPVALLIPASLVGWVSGFLLLEDRDEGTLLAIDVTPVGKSGFLAYRVGITALVSLAITAYAWPLIAPHVATGTMVLLSLLIAADAVASAVVLPAIARNKVEGLALTKLTNIVSIAPLIAFLPTPFRYFAGVVPTYWIGELLLPVSSPALPFAVTATLAIVLHIATVAGLFTLLRRRAG